MKNQLFKETIPVSLFWEILSSFGITNIYMDCFSLESLKRTGIEGNMRRLSSKLEKYYIPCKAEVYLCNITIKKCMTILRQILREFGMKLTRETVSIYNSIYRLEFLKSKLNKLVYNCNCLKIEQKKTTYFFN